MNCRGGRVNPALQIVSAVVMLPLASASLAGEGFGCTFTQECISGGTCKAREGLGTVLTRTGGTGSTGWIVSMPDGQPIEFTEIEGAREGTIHLVSSDIDPGADAAAMLTIGADGQAVISTHGYFPNLSVATHLGTCVPKDN